MWDWTPIARRPRPGSSGLGVAPVLVAGLVIVLIGGCSGAAGHDSTAGARTAKATPDQPSSTTPTPAPSSQDTVSTATPRQLTGLVRIVASIGNDGRGETSTGMILTGDGEAVTSNHGVAGATAVQATVMSTGRTYTARVVAADPAHDVALLRLDGASGLASVTLAERDAAVGDRVAVVGDARGLRSTFAAATGTVLALDQTLVAPATGNTRAERLTGLTLSTCNVVSGESGGATYGADGRVVGMTTATVRTRRALDGVAIPSGTLRTVIRDLERRSAR